MHDRRVALLRGINIGTAKRVAMADLRALVEGLGYTDVRTLLMLHALATGAAPAPGRARAARPARSSRSRA